MLVFELGFQVPTGGFVSTYSVPIPNDSSAAGLAIYTQALMLGQDYALTNAVDLVVGS